MQCFGEHVEKLELVQHIPIIYVLIHIDLISIKYIYEIGILETSSFTVHMKNICILFSQVYFYFCKLKKACCGRISINPYENNP